MRTHLVTLGLHAIGFAIYVIPAVANTVNLSTGSDAYSIVSDTVGCPGSCEGTVPTLVTGIPGGWVTDLTDTAGDSGLWIAPQANQTNGGPYGNTGTIQGTVVYELQFSLAGLDPSSAILTMNLAADDFVGYVTLNGDTIFSPTSSEISNGMWTTPSGSFTINDSSDYFNAGLNTLLFEVPNNSSDGSDGCCGPTGLDVAGSLTANSVATPEPSTYLPLDLAFLVVGGTFLYRRSRA